MAMRFHQKRFFAYPSGAPSLHTLSAVSSHSYTLVTTDRSVSLLDYGEAGYSLHKLDVDVLRSGKADIIASAVVERPGTRQSHVAVAYAVEDTLHLLVLAPHHESLGNGEAAEASGCGKFELEAAPTCMFSVRAAGTNGDIFYGVIVCCTDSMMAFGYVESEKETPATTSSSADCVRLNNEQFGIFFPEFVSFVHTILAVDIFVAPERDQGWIAFGCADGLVRVFHGQMYRGCLDGPFNTKDLQLNGPVTSVALFPKRAAPAQETSPTWRCNLLVSCAIGQAVVYEDLYNTTDKDKSSEVLSDSDAFDSIFAGIAADIDLDGKVELLLGTDSQVMLAFKEGSIEKADDCLRDEDSTKDLVESTVDNSTAAVGNTSPPSLASSHNIWNDSDPLPVADSRIQTGPACSLTRQRKWQRLSRSCWDLETFGAIYSLLWRDVNHDGVPELLIASSTGVYVYEADPTFVIEKLECVLSALHISSAE